MLAGLVGELDKQESVFVMQSIHEYSTNLN